jgi:hypothetical protein
VGKNNVIKYALLETVDVSGVAVTAAAAAAVGSS